jgi:hypothetical protein
VNFIYPYEELRAANVTGTRELIRLAGLARGIPVHYVSSTAVLAGLGVAGVRYVTENTPLAHPGRLRIGYVETKYVAEELLRNAGRARRRAEQALAGSGIAVPPVDARLLDGVIGRLIATGYLTAPRASRLAARALPGLGVAGDRSGSGRPAELLPRERYLTVLGSSAERLALPREPRPARRLLPADS